MPRTRFVSSVFVIAGTRDTIAQTGMAVPLATDWPGAHLRTPPLGHVGMIAGRDARGAVLRPVVEFLHATA